jgi:hypothetical protein
MQVAALIFLQIAPQHKPETTVAPSLARDAVAIGCPYCRMLYSGHPRQWHDATCGRAVPEQPKSRDYSPEEDKRYTGHSLGFRCAEY